MLPGVTVCYGGCLKLFFSMERGRVAKRLAVLTTLFVLAATADAASEPHNLLLITVDTLRADYLSCNGSTRVETPHLDRLAASGVNFTRARAQVPLTLPSHASILTGYLPPNHTVRDNGGYRLPATQRTLAEVLDEAGYDTAAFVGSFVLDRRFGLAQGFDHYDDRTWSDLSMLENLEAERPAEAVFDSFRGWLADRDGTAPLFAWIHLYDPHAPYAAPEPYGSRYPNDPYAGEVAYTDQVIGRIVAELVARDLLSTTVVAVVGDHGESLGEHGEGTHSLLAYNATLHVPMIVSAPGVLAPGTSVDSLVRTIDLAPTLLDYLGHEPRLGEGVSLRTRIEGEEPAAPLFAYSESLYPRLHLGWSELVGFEGARYRIVVAPEPELYDLEADPGETENLYATERDAFRRLWRRLEELRAGFPADNETAHPAVTDPDTVARLRSLGYLSGGAVPPGSSGADPKEKMVIWRQLQTAMAQFGAGAFARAAAELEQALASEPGVPLLYEYLGASYMHLQRWEEAEAVYRRALEHGFESSRTLIDLGLIYRRRGEDPRAESALEAALEVDPVSVEAHHHLGDLLRASGRIEAALGRYRQALAINPEYVYSWNGLGMALAANRRDGEALEAFRRAAGVDPDEPLGQFNLAVQLERMGRDPEAAIAYERFLSLSDGRVELRAERQRAAESIDRLRQ